MRYRIVEGDNFGGDYPDEIFVTLPLMSKESAQDIANIINENLSGHAAPRFWFTVEENYKLIPGFEP